MWKNYKESRLYKNSFYYDMDSDDILFKLFSHVVIKLLSIFEKLLLELELELKVIGFIL
jgi:hypothetical protein